MKSTIMLLAEMLTCILMIFFLVLAVVTPWCAWKIVCIVLCSIFGIGFITTFVLTRTPKFKPQEEEQVEDEVKDEAVVEEVKENA